MKMTFRWYGAKSDPIPLKYVKQIPGMTGLMGLLDKPAGVVWEEDEIKALVDEVHAAGLEFEVVESVNVHEDIKMGLPTRDEYIANYITSVRNLAKYGVKVIVYNFMPVFDWLRTDLAREIPEDGSNSLYFNEVDLGEMGPMEIVRRTAEDSKGFTLPGWEPERLALLETTLKQYEGITPDMLRENYKYFLERVCPVCEEVGVKLACHPDDPAWPIFGLPRIAHSQADYDIMVKLHDSPCNTLCLCSLFRFTDRSNFGVCIDNGRDCIIAHTILLADHMVYRNFCLAICSMSKHALAVNVTCSIYARNVCSAEIIRYNSSAVKLDTDCFKTDACSMSTATD